MLKKLRMEDKNPHTLISLVVSQFQSCMEITYEIIPLLWFPVENRLYTEDFSHIFRN